jgi:hypothetical protein
MILAMGGAPHQGPGSQHLRVGPDYVILKYSFGSKFFGGTGSIAVDRYWHVYFSPGPSVGYRVPGGSFARLSFD